MILLAWRQVLFDPRSLAAIAAISLASTLALSLVGSATIFEALQAPQSQGAFGSIAAFTLLTLATSVSSTASLGVRVNRRLFASWMIVGVTPRQVSQALLVRSVVSATAGALLAVPFAAGLVSPVTSGYASLGILPRSPSPAEALSVTTSATTIAAALVIVLVGLATLPAALSASRTSPALTLRETDREVRASPLVRWLVAGAILLLTQPPTVGALLIGASPPGAEAISDTLGITPAIRVIALASSVSLWLVIGAAIVMPASGRRLILLWTACVPGQLSATWHLARHAAAERVSVASSTVVIGGIVIGLVGSVQGAVDVARLIDAPPDSHWAELIWTLGPSAGVALVGGGVALTIGRATEEHDSHLLAHMGASASQRLRLDLLKVVIYTITALLPALGIWALSVTTAALVAPFLGVPITPTPPDVRPLIVAAALITVANAVAVLGAHVTPSRWVRGGPDAHQ